VLAANVAGAAAFAFTAARTAMFDGEVKAAFADIAREHLAAGAGPAFLRAIVSGWLIALLVWVLPEAGDTARVVVIFALTAVMGAGGFGHVVAGSVAAAYAGAAGIASWSTVVVAWLLPVLAGNVLGGTSLVAALANAQVKADEGEA